MKEKGYTKDSTIAHINRVINDVIENEYARKKLGKQQKQRGFSKSFCEEKTLAKFFGCRTNESCQCQKYKSYKKSSKTHKSSKRFKVYRRRKHNGDASQIKCFICNKMGHYASKCPHKDKSKQFNSNVLQDANYKIKYCNTLKQDDILLKEYATSSAESSSSDHTSSTHHDYIRPTNISYALECEVQMLNMLCKPFPFKGKAKQDDYYQSSSLSSES